LRRRPCFDEAQKGEQAGIFGTIQILLVPLSESRKTSNPILTFRRGHTERKCSVVPKEESAWRNAGSLERGGHRHHPRIPSPSFPFSQVDRRAGERPVLFQRDQERDLLVGIAEGRHRAAVSHTLIGAGE
jgi:hypothetical protein